MTPCKIIYLFFRRKTAAHSWNIFQQSLTLNQAIGELLLQLEELDITCVLKFLVIVNLADYIYHPS